MTPAQVRARVRQVWALPGGQLRSALCEELLADVLEHVLAGCPEDLASELARIALEARRPVESGATPLVDDAQRYIERRSIQGGVR